MTTPNTHEAVTAAAQLRSIAANWAALLEQLPAGGGSSTGGGGGGNRNARETPLPYNVHVSDLIAEVTDWAIFLTRVLMDEVTVTRREPTKEEPDRVVVELWTPPDGATTPVLLRTIARERIGHFTTHPDDGVRETFIADAERLSLAVRRAAYPTRRPPATTRIPCEHRATNPDGTVARCTGTYTLSREGAAPDLVCNVDRAHRVAMASWVAGDLRPAQAIGAEALLAALKSPDQAT